MDEVLDLIRPPDGASAEKISRYRVNIMVVLACLIAYSVWGVFTYARAPDVDKAIAASVVPVTKDIGEIKEKQIDLGKKLDELSAAQRDQLLGAIRAELVEFKVKQCNAEKAKSANLVEVYRAEVVRLTNQYLGIPNAPAFKAPPCADL